MDDKDIQITAAVCVKAAAELHAGTGRSDLALGAAEEFFAWIIERSGGGLPTGTGGGGAVVASSAAPSPPPSTEDACPKCGGPVYDNYTENLKRAIDGKKPLPIKKCKNKDGCGWVRWN